MCCLWCVVCCPLFLVFVLLLAFVPLLVSCCWMCDVVACWLLFWCWLSVGCRLLLGVVVCCLLCVVCCLLCVVCCLLLVVCCSLCVVCCLLVFVVCCLLFGVLVSVA